MEIKRFENILFAIDHENEMVNATDLVKGYPSKRVNDYLRLKSTIEYQNFLESVTGNPATLIKQGGTSQGTWMTLKLALDFSAWLDVRLRDFIYDTFLNSLKDKMKNQQRQLDYFWDKQDQQDLYK